MKRKVTVTFNHCGECWKSENSREVRQIPMTFGGFDTDLVREYRCRLSNNRVIHHEYRDDLNEANYISNQPIPDWCPLLEED